MPKKQIDLRQLEEFAGRLTFFGVANAVGLSGHQLWRRLKSEPALLNAYNRGRTKAARPLFGGGNSRPLEVRFWEKVDRRPGNQCWLWTGATDSSGYGSLLGFDGRVEGAHRVSYRLNVGPIPKGKKIRHVVCDNPPCVRPDHIAPGSQKQNIKDMYDKGRASVPRRRLGEENPMATVSNEQAEEIRKLRCRDRVKLRILAKQFNTSEATVSRIARGKTRATEPG
jgi:HNH endonuclease